jgi:sn1-specific diacylglycerol lipase
MSQTEEAYRSFSRKVLSPLNSEDYSLMEEGARFARHQLAIYTWMLYYYQYPVTGTFRLIAKSLKRKLKTCTSTNNTMTNTQRVSRGNNYETYSTTPNVESGVVSESSSLSQLNQETIVGDNFLHIHEATMLAHAGLDKSDVAYASFEAGFYETPYCIIIDRKWKSVVLSIRGSLTLEDCVVDVLLDPSPLDDLGEKYGFDGTGQYCHGGVVECANWLHEDLMRYGRFVFPNATFDGTVGGNAHS